MIMRVPRKIQECSESVGEVNTLPSMTVPDQTMSIRTIIQRFAQGLPTPVGKELVYSEDMPDYRGLDITEIYQMREAVSQNIENLQKEIRQREIMIADEKRLEQEEKRKQLLLEMNIKQPLP